MPRKHRDDTRRKTIGRRLVVESLESRQLMTAAPLGALPFDTAEFMLGRVAVTPVLLESDGSEDASTEDWTSAEIAQVLENVQTGMQWWVDTLAGVSDVHELEFVIDDTFAVNPVPTPFEPITRRSNDYFEYVGQFLLDQGYSAGQFTLDNAIRDFNNRQREKLNTDWSFTIFVVDSSADADGQFDHTGSFRQAFAFAGGLFFVTPSTRPASTYAHETGHMFWARDEYPNSASHNARRGYYNSQNSNAIDDAPQGFVQQTSIMSSGVVLQTAYDTNTSAAATLAQIGWLDSDGDGIFDVLDVPLSLDVDAAFDAESGRLKVRGTASAVPLLNRNSAGLQNDITLNEISRLEYRLEGGDWVTLISPNLQVADIDLDVQISDPTSGVTAGLIELRAVDASTGIISNVVEVLAETATPGDTRGVNGFVYADANDDGRWGSAESLLFGVNVSLVDANGLIRGRLEPDDSEGAVYGDSIPNLTIRSLGNQVNGQVGAFLGTEGTGAASFNYGSIFGGWGDSWSRHRHELSIELNVPTTQVSIVAVGKQSNSVARLEAYDENGELILRTTSDPINNGQSVTLTLSDPQNRIKSIRAFGTAGTSVSLDDFRYGPEITTTTSQLGTFQLAGLPDGVYTVELVSSSPRYEIEESTRTIAVDKGASQPLAVRALQAVSPWMNPNNPLDVNNEGGVQALDALVVINDLNRNGNRMLTAADTTPPYLDANGDFEVSPLDALIVINYLNRWGETGVPGPAGEGESGVGGNGGNSGKFGGGSGAPGEGESWDLGFTVPGNSPEGEDDSNGKSRAAATDAFFEGALRNNRAAAEVDPKAASKDFLISDLVQATQIPENYLCRAIGVAEFLDEFDLDLVEKFRNLPSTSDSND